MSIVQRLPSVTEINDNIMFLFIFYYYNVNCFIKWLIVNKIVYTSAKVTTILVSWKLDHLQASPSVNYSSLDRNGILPPRYVQLVAKKTGTVRIKLAHFYSVKLSCERLELWSKFNDTFKNYLKVLSSRQLIDKWTKPNLHYENFHFPFFFFCNQL
jgi:hypothetical protein